jgi:hypothetical protein
VKHLNEDTRHSFYRSTFGFHICGASKGEFEAPEARVGAAAYWVTLTLTDKQKVLIQNQRASASGSLDPFSEVIVVMSCGIENVVNSAA